MQNYKNERRKLVVAFSMNGLQSGAISRLRETTLLSVITTIATTPQPSGRLTFFNVEQPLVGARYDGLARLVALFFASFLRLAFSFKRLLFYLANYG